MPIVVGTDQRRTKVIAIAFDQVADNGTDALTLREMVAANGCSASIVSDYFRNKSALLFKGAWATSWRLFSRRWRLPEPDLPSSCHQEGN